MNEFELHRHLRRVRALPGTIARHADASGADRFVPGALDGHDPPKTVDEYLDTLLKQGLTQTVGQLREWKVAV